LRPGPDSDRRARKRRRKRSAIPQCLRTPFARRASREQEYPPAPRFQSSCSCEFQLRERGEFVAIDAAFGARRPGIALRELLRIGETAEQGFAVGDIVDHLLADGVETDPIAPLGHAFEVPALLAIKLCQ